MQLIFAMSPSDSGEEDIIIDYCYYPIRQTKQGIEKSNGSVPIRKEKCKLSRTRTDRKRKFIAFYRMSEESYLELTRPPFCREDGHKFAGVLACREKNT